VERKHRVVPVDFALDGPRIRVNQDLVGIAAKASREVPWTVDPETITLASGDPGNISMPAKRPCLGKVYAALVSGGVEEAQFNARCDLGEHREVTPVCVERRTEWIP
jgi:hypothetical protein